MQKNVASQKWTVFAFDRTDNTAKTGDSGNITGSVWGDGVENVIGDSNPTELAHGLYEFDVDQAETNYDYIVMDAVSGTSNIQVVGCPAALWTTAPYFNVMGIESDGDVHADLKQWLGVAPLALVSQYVKAVLAAVPPTSAQIKTAIEAVGSHLTLIKAVTDVESGVKAAVNALNNLSSANVTTACTSSLNTYDPPKYSEMVTALAALNDITVANIIAGIADGSNDLQEMLRIIFAACSGKSSGGGTATLKFRDSGDAKDRITATVDEDGNRSAVTLDGS